MGPIRTEQDWSDHPFQELEHRLRQEAGETELLHAENPHSDTWVHLLDPGVEEDPEHYLVISEVFLKEPDGYERENLEAWGDRVLNIVSVSEVRVVVENDYHWRIELDIASAGGLIPVLHALVLFKVEWIKGFPANSWRTDRLTVIRLD